MLLRAARVVVDIDGVDSRLPAHERPLEEIARKDWSLERAESQAIFNDKAAHPWPAPQPPKRST